MEKEIRTIFWKDDAVVMIDQRALPLHGAFVTCTDYRKVIAAINDLDDPRRPGHRRRRCDGDRPGRPADRGRYTGTVPRGLPEALRGICGQPPHGPKPLLGDRANETVLRFGFKRRYRDDAGFDTTAAGGNANRLPKTPSRRRSDAF